MAGLIAILKRKKETRSPFIRLKSYITASDIVLTKINLSLCFFSPLTLSHTPTHMLVVILLDILRAICFTSPRASVIVASQWFSLLQEHLKPISETLTRHAMSV